MLFVSKIRAARLAGAALLLMVCAAPAFAQAPPPAAAKKDDGIVIDVDGILRLIGDPKTPPPVEPKKQPDGIILRTVVDPNTVPATDAEKLKLEIQKLEAALQQRLAETQKLKADIEAARAKMKAAAEAPKEVHDGRIILRLDDGKGSDEIVLRKVDGKWTVVPADAKGGPARVIKVPVDFTPVAPPATRVPTPDIKIVPADANQRIDSLEKKLDKVMDALEKMRKEMDGSRRKASAEDALKGVEQALDNAKKQEVDRARAEEALRAAEKALKDAKPLEFKLTPEKPR